VPTAAGIWVQPGAERGQAQARMIPGNLERERAPAEPRQRMHRGWLVRRLLVAADVLALVTAFVLIELFLHGGRLVGTDRMHTEAAILLLAIPVWILVAKLYGLYDRDEERAAHSSVDEFVDVFHLITVGLWVFYLSVWMIGLSSPNQKKLVAFWFLAIALVTAARASARAIARRQAAYLQNTIIVGAGEVGQLVGRKLLQHPEYGINLLGFVDAQPKTFREDLRGLPLIGGPHDLRDVVARNDVDRVILAFSNESHEELLKAVHSLRKLNVQIDVVPRLFEALNPRVGIHSVEGLPLLSLPPARIPRSSLMLKRLVDLVVASVLLVCLGPLMLVIAFLIRRDSSAPALFRQTRIGMDMHEFTLLKFRTMHADTDDADHRNFISRVMGPTAVPESNGLYKLERAETVTRIGRLLRRTSIDELPQLINVLRGDMSLVGPRPCLPYEIDFFAPQHFERFLVPAGLTGLWQVEARAHSTFGEALDLDVLYSRGWSLWLDLRLLVRTPILMLRTSATD
jgi:exopolysaccharide biosynthesis polyprenyl glycosylphosphotransferase